MPGLRLTSQVLTVGMTYRDLVMTGLGEIPKPGVEIYASALHETWGGIANMTRVCRALGSQTALCTPVGDDAASQRLLAELAEADIDTSLCQHHLSWELPVTVALSLPEDRAMVTVETPPPTPIGANLASAELEVAAAIIDLRDPAQDWLQRLRANGTKVYASRGFDPTGQWDAAAISAADSCDVWMLNELEASAFSGSDDPLQAAKLLAEKVPLVVVTRAAKGMVGFDAQTGEIASVPGFAVEAVNTTGAGDTTLAALAFTGLFPSLGLQQRLELAAFIAAQTISRPGGAANPPSLAELTAAIPADQPQLTELFKIISVPVMEGNK